MLQARCLSCIFPGADPVPIFAAAELNIISMVAVVSEISMAGPNNSAALMGSCWATPPHPARRDQHHPSPPLAEPQPLPVSMLTIELKYLRMS